MSVSWSLNGSCWYRLLRKLKRDQRIAQLTDELTLKSSLLEQAEANVAETAKRAGLELREHLDQPLTETSMAKQSDQVDMKAKLEEFPLSRDQQIGQYGKKLANVRAKLEAKESELEAIRLRLTDAEKGWTKSKAEADTLRAQIAAGLSQYGRGSSHAQAYGTYASYDGNRDGLTAEEGEKRIYIVSQRGRKWVLVGQCTRGYRLSLLEGD